MKKYTVIGNIGSTIIKNRPFTNNEDITIIVRDIWNEEQPPVMLTVIGSFQKYIKELTGHDYEEKYMKKKFTYTSWCDLESIEILDKKGKTIKTIFRDTPEKDFTKWIN